MTLSVESLNKLYFQIIEQFISALLGKPSRSQSAPQAKNGLSDVAVLGWT
jgi:hypothetical protein